MNKHLNTLGENAINVMLTLETTPKTSSGGSHRDNDHKVSRGPLSQIAPMLNFMEFDDNYDPEDRAKNIPMCPAPMTSRGDNSAFGFSLENNLCSTPCYKAKMALRQKVTQPDMVERGQRYGLCIVKGEHRPTQEDRVSYSLQHLFEGYLLIDLMRINLEY